MAHYREFTSPPTPSGGPSVKTWVTWLNDEGVLHDPSPVPGQCCSFCHGAVSHDVLGSAVRTCHHCRRYGNALESLAFATYSLDGGLESLLHRYKDWRGYEWLIAPVGSLLYRLLQGHLPCIEAITGPIDFATFVPSNNRKREFEPMRRAAARLLSWPITWRHDVVGRNWAVDRPGRGELKPSAYWATGSAIARRTVLLVDDVWTSGSSMASCAEALKIEGASAVVGVTLGRHLNSDRHWGTSADLVAEVRNRGWSDTCSLCA